MDKSLSTELSASKYYIDSYAQESVDKVGQNLGTSRWWPAGGRWRDPPLAGLAGATVAALNTYKKNFKKNFAVVNKQVKLCKNVNSTNNGANE